VCSYSSFRVVPVPAYRAASCLAGSEMSDLARQLGRRIYLFRKQSGFTQAALAERAKISNEFMSGIERGAKLPSLVTLEKIAAALDVSLKDLFNFDRTAFRRTERMSRPTLDLASLLERLPEQNRHRIVKVVKILAARTEQ
jgi:transcriptional regulator with XRE-family HTH domain